MDTSHATTLVNALRRLPDEGDQRDLALQRLTELYAAAAARSALQAAAARAAGTGALGDVLAAADAAWDGASVRADADLPDAAARDQLRAAVTAPAFLNLVPEWIGEMREIAVTRPGTGACTVASALQLWLWTVNHFRVDSAHRAAALADLADALCPLLAARCRILELVAAPPQAGAAGSQELLTDLCHVHAARTAGAVGTACAELVFGYRRHLAWDAEGCSTCYGAEPLDELEGLIPGIASAARAAGDVIEPDGSHAPKAGPCARFHDLETFTRLRARLDGCLTGARLARDRAAAALPRVLPGAPATRTS